MKIAFRNLLLSKLILQIKTKYIPKKKMSLIYDFIFTQITNTINQSINQLPNVSHSNIRTTFYHF